MDFDLLGCGDIGIIDVGSVGGLTEPWRSNSGVIKFLLNFEPNDSPVKGEHFVTYNTAVWEKDSILPFYIYKGFNATGSSLFKADFEYVKNNYEDLKNRGLKNLAETWFERAELVKTTQILCRSLDNILQESFNDQVFHFMKVDAQGAEYNILKGASQFLSKNCVGLHLELFVLPLYKDIVLMDEVMLFLNSFGFSLVKKFPAHGSFDSQHDCLFLKKDGDANILRTIKNIYGISE
jgi:FkbM family methyltransferase